MTFKRMPGAAFIVDITGTTDCLGGFSPFHGIHTLCFAYPGHDLIANSTRMKFSSGIGGREDAQVSQKNYEAAYLLKLLYCILLRESVDLQPTRTAISLLGILDHQSPM